MGGCETASRQAELQARRPGEQDGLGIPRRGADWQSPQARAASQTAAILTKHGRQPLRSEPQTSLRGY